MLPDQPWLVMCPHCHELLWLDELEELGEFDPWGDKRDEFKDARGYGMPSLDDYLALLAGGIDDPVKERYTRLRAWWEGNDQRRNNAGEIPMSAREAENLTAFAQMLDESDSSDLVMKAEAMRELGRFDDALSLLGKSVDESVSQAVDMIKGLAETRDPYVRELHFK